MKGRNSVVVSIRIPDDVYAMIEKMAEKKRVTVSVFIKGKVEEYARLTEEAVVKSDEYVVIGGQRFKKPD